MLKYSTRGKRAEVERLAARAHFYRTFSHKLSIELEKTRRELDALQPAVQPIIKNEEVNTQLQYGESQLLGGAMQISHPAFRKTE